MSQSKALRVLIIISSWILSYGTIPGLFINRSPQKNCVGKLPLVSISLLQWKWLNTYKTSKYSCKRFTNCSLLEAICLFQQWIRALNPTLKWYWALSISLALYLKALISGNYLYLLLIWHLFWNNTSWKWSMYFWYGWIIGVRSWIWFDYGSNARIRQFNVVHDDS